MRGALSLKTLDATTHPRSHHIALRQLKTATNAYCAFSCGGKTKPNS